MNIFMKNNKKIIFIHLLNDLSGSTKVLSDIVDICELHQIDKLHILIIFDGFLYNKRNIVSSYFYNRHNKLSTLISYILSQLIFF